MSERYLKLIAQGLILTVIMLGLIAAALWLRPGPVETAAQARTMSIASEGGLQDRGKQRLEMIDELKAINENLAELRKGLENGTYKVRIEDPEKAKK